MSLLASAVDPAGRGADESADLFWIMVAIATPIYLGVLVLLIAALIRRRNASADGPRALSGSGFVIGGGVVLPVVVGIALLVLTLTTMAAVAGRSGDEELRIRVEGHQWWWGVTYEREGIEIANELRIPAGRPVHVELRSDNVAHSFWVPALAGKLDLIPGKVNELTLEASEPGVYRGECAEFCGLQHAKMNFLVVALEPGAYDAWIEERLAARRQLAETRDRMPAGLGFFLGAGCNQCHTIAGTPADGLVGPDLTHVGNRLSLGAGEVRNTAGELARWIADPHRVKPGVKMPRFEAQLEPAQLAELVAYLEGLE